MTAQRKIPTLGDHDIVRLIAKGGMGSVFEVRNRVTGAVHAAKTINRADDPAARERFRHEAELLARVDRHPGIVKVHAFGESAEGMLYLILDLVPGESLETLLEREKTLAPVRAAAIARAVALALGHAHALGIVHRDVKPPNILIEPDGTPRLTDFGLALARDLERLTRTATFLGTISYCSPEQALGGEVGPWSDVFALGCVLYRTLAGVPPVAGDVVLEILARLADTKPLPDVRELAPDVPAPLAAIVARALAHETTARYQNGTELARDLERFLGGDRVHARPRSRVALRALALLGTLALAATALVATGVWLMRQGPASSALPSSLAAETAAAEATRRLARGAARDALAILDATPGDSLTPPSRVVRARALLALGRGEAAATEATLALARGADPVEAGELLGDARSSTGDHPGAEEAYRHALEAGAKPTDAATLRAKRGGAAALAGDRAMALADLDALLPDLRVVGPEREENARFAPIAPALYLRGIESGDVAEGDRDLDAAWRLAPAPPSLEKALARAWTARAVTASSAWALEIVHHMKIEDRDADVLRGILARVLRARTFDPSVGLAPFGTLNRQLRSLYASNVDPKLVEAFARKMLRDWPDEPIFLYLLGRALRARAGAELREGFETLEHAIDVFPPEAPDEDPEIRSLARDTALLLLDAIEVKKEVRIDMARLEKIVARANHTDGWERLANALLGLGRRKEALACYEKADQADPTYSRPRDRVRALAIRAELLMSLERIDDALALVHARERDELAGLRILALAAERSKHPELVVRLVDPKTVSDGITLIQLGRALVTLDRLDDARAVQAVLIAAHNDPAAAEVDRAIQGARPEKKK